MPIVLLLTLSVDEHYNFIRILLGCVGTKWTVPYLAFPVMYYPVQFTARGSMWGNTPGTSPSLSKCDVHRRFRIRPTLFFSNDGWRDLEDRMDVPYWYRVRTRYSSFLGWRVGSFECIKPRTWERRKANVDPKGLVLVTSSFGTRSSRESNSQPHSSIASSGQIWGLKSSSFCIVIMLSLWVSSDGQVGLRVACTLCMWRESP